MNTSIQIRRRGDKITAVRVQADGPTDAIIALHKAACVAKQDQQLSRFSMFNSGFRQDSPGWWIARRHGDQ